MTLLRTVLVVLLSLCAAAQAAGRDADLYFFDASFGDLKDELQQARAEGKRGLFLMFAAEECPPCQRMKKTVLSQAPVQQYYRKHFRVIHIDFNGDAEVADVTGKPMRSKDFAQKVARVRGTPAFMVIGLEGEELLRHHGPVYDAKQFMLLGDYVVSGAYRQRKFEDYWRQRVAAAR
jgi:thioredoxin-related protein